MKKWLLISLVSFACLVVLQMIDPRLLIKEGDAFNIKHLPALLLCAIFIISLILAYIKYREETSEIRALKKKQKEDARIKKLLENNEEFRKAILDFDIDDEDEG